MAAVGIQISTNFKMSTLYVGAVYKHTNMLTAGSNPDVLSSDVRTVSLASIRILKTSKRPWHKSRLHGGRSRSLSLSTGNLTTRVNPTLQRCASLHYEHGWVMSPLSQLAKVRGMGKLKCVRFTTKPQLANFEGS
jgi:hypothetical protein